MKACSDFVADGVGRRLCATPAAREQARMPKKVDDPAVKAVQVRLGAKIKARREKQGLSQGEVAAAAGVDRSYLSTVETGSKSVTISVLARISIALGTTPSALTHGIMSDNSDEAVHQGA